MNNPNSNPVGNSRLDRLMKEMTIKREPLHTLSACLDCYSLEYLTEMAEHYKLEIAGVGKPEIITAICENIISRMPADILFDDLSDLEKYLQICTSQDGQAELELFSGVFKYIVRGWMFYFTGTGGNQVKLTLPDEISSFIEKSLVDETCVAKADKTKDLLKYMWALDHLYGVYEKSQFIKVWDSLHETPLSGEEFAEFLKELLLRYSICHEEGDYIVSNSFTDYYTCSNILLSTKDQPYYMPTATDIETYQEAKVDLKSLPYEAIKKYLNKKLQDKDDLDDALFQMEAAVVIESSADDIMKLLNANNVAFDNPEDAQVFWQLYTQLADSVRLWTHRGFTAVEAGIEVNYQMSDVSKDLAVKFKKIGRNEPCPCGSGKKYKNCCGKTVQEE